MIIRRWKKKPRGRSFGERLLRESRRLSEESPPAFFGRSRSRIVSFTLLSLLFFLGPSRLARAEQEFHLRVLPALYLPLADELFDPGLTVAAEIDWRLLPFFGLSLEGDYTALRDKAGGISQMPSFGLGPYAVWRPLSRLGFKLGFAGGLYSASYNEQSISGITWSGKVSAELHITPSVTVVPFAGFTQYSYTPEPLVNTFKAGLGVSINLSELVTPKTRLEVRKLNQYPVFPVSYAWYRDNPIAVVRITNREPNDITMLAASFYLEQFMNQPSLCGTKEILKPGESVDIPVTAFFNESMLQLLENITANAKILVDYRSLGVAKKAEIPVEIPVYHRNAMSWDDDRRASSFVSSRDPAAQYFSRYANSLVVSRLRPGINRNIQVALGIFEALAVYGVNYVIDPSSSYVEMSESSSSLDSLNFPYQTLMYRGGDCDDLSILFSSLLEAAGIETAFITIPGHIYMAFDSGLGEAEARRDFYAPEELVYHEGRAWVPLEVTIPREGFYRAWRIGAKEWHDAEKTGAAEIHLMHDSWKVYPPVSVPGEASDLSIPTEQAIAAAFDRAMDNYIEYEIRLPVREYELRLARGEDPALRNEFGVLYGRFGMLGKAREQFIAAARLDNVDALVNLGNVAFMEQRFEDSLYYYQQALLRDENNSIAILGCARTYYEVNNFIRADTYYGRLRGLDRNLAQNYSYLVSFFENRGRAYSLADRLITTSWSLPAAASPEQSVAEAVAESPVVNQPPGQPLGLPGFESVVTIGASPPAEAPSQVIEMPFTPALAVGPVSAGGNRDEEEPEEDNNDGGGDIDGSVLPASVTGEPAPPAPPPPTPAPAAEPVELAQAAPVEAPAPPTPAPAAEPVELAQAEPVEAPAPAAPAPPAAEPVELAQAAPVEAPALPATPPAPPPVAAPALPSVAGPVEIAVPSESPVLSSAAVPAAPSAADE
ncbi:MAG: hypothetical protein LBJ90_04440, partial [Treponema sp.]|nr:hypothetical protein [Treponema sp.]